MDYCKSSKTKGIIAAVITLAATVVCSTVAVLVIYNINSYTPFMTSCFEIWVFSLIFACMSFIPVTVLTVIGIVHGAKAIKRGGKKSALVLNITVLCLSQLLGYALLFMHIIIIGMTF